MVGEYARDQGRRLWQTDALYADSIIVMGLVSVVAAVAVGLALVLVVGVVCHCCRFFHHDDTQGCTCACIGTLVDFLTISYVLRGLTARNSGQAWSTSEACPSQCGIMRTVASS